MPAKRILANNEIYHVIVRGVSDMLIFKNDQDRYRAIFSLYEFNNNNSVVIRDKRERRKKAKIEIAIGPSYGNSKKRELLVEIFAFCFMPNHIHLLLKQVKDDGVSKFMRKFGTGYAGYFNKRYNRKGYLFQGRFKSVHINSQSQLLVIFSYIHTNPVSLIEPRWKEKGIKNLKKTTQFLENYKWSSYNDYLGKQNFSSITKRDFLLEAMRGADGCKKFINDWLKHKHSLRNDL